MLERFPICALVSPLVNYFDVITKIEMITERKCMNSLDKILSAMRTGKYGSVVDTKGKIHVGIINSLLREDGSNKNWIVTVSNRTVTEQVFIHAS